MARSSRENQPTRWRPGLVAAAPLVVLGLVGLSLTGCGNKDNKPTVSKAGSQGQQIDPVKLAFDQLYYPNCSGCHGANGADGSAVPLNNPMFLKLVSNEQLKDVIGNGRPGTLMPPYASSRVGALDFGTPAGVKEEPGGPGVLTKDQIDKLIAGMRAEWGKPMPDLKNPPPLALQKGADGKLIGDVAAGKKLFDDLYADSWLGKMTPRNRGWYLLITSNQEIRRLIITGWKHVGLPDYRHVRKGNPLTGDQVNDLVAYINSLRDSAGTMAEQYRKKMQAAHQ